MIINANNINIFEINLELINFFFEKKIPIKWYKIKEIFKKKFWWYEIKMIWNKRGYQKKFFFPKWMYKSN